MDKALSLIAATTPLILLAAFGHCEDPAVKDWPKDYRHIHLPKVKLATSGKFAEIVPLSQQMLADYPHDGEALFFLGLAQAQLGNSKEAEQTLVRASQVGLPSERFLAGPRPWVSAFHDNKAFAAFRDKHAGLIHGPMLGCIAPDSVKVWVRTAQPVPIEVRVRGAGKDDVHLGKGNTTQAADYTSVIAVSGLQPNAAYSYEVSVDGKKIAAAQQKFRTAPAAGDRVQVQIGFGGGAAYTPKFEHMWKTIAARRPELFFFLGDNVYIDNPTLPEYQRYLYYRRQSQPDFRALCSATGIYSIWDDHDFATNDSAGGPDLHKPAWKIPVWNVFRQNWNNPGYGGGDKQPGCWFDYVYGDVHFIFLDGRFYRDPKGKDGKEAPTMLGPAQLQWLLDTLKNSRATFIVILSPVPWVGGNPDKWNGFPEEREKIFSFIEKNRIEGVLLMSADRHRSDVLVTRRPKGYDLYEFMSSRLTNVHTHGKAGEKDGAIFSYNEKCSFGLLGFDTTRADPEILYRIINIDNEEIHRFSLKKSQLRF